MNKFTDLLLKYILGKPSSNYCHGYILRKYLKFPSFLPLNAQIQHGWYSGYFPDIEEQKKISVMLVWSKRMADQWKEKSNKPVYILGPPFFHYRKLQHITRKETAKGTVVFPNHSSPNTMETYSAEDFSKSLEELPDRFKPFTICLHFRDMDHYGPQFLQLGYNVVTAGNSRQRKDGFAKNFYEILSSHQYCCSNELGSYTFYSLEMKIPFFLIGPEGRSVYRNDPQKEIKRYPFLIESRKIFETPQTNITEDQQNYFESECGINDSIDPDFLKKKILFRFIYRELFLIPFRIIRFVFLIPNLAIQKIRKKND